MDWPRIEIAHRPRVEVSIPAMSPRVVVGRDEIRLALPDRLPMVSVVLMLIVWALAVGFVGVIVYFMANDSPDDRPLIFAIGGIVAFFATVGVIGGFVGGWYMGKSKGPLAVHRLGSDEVAFPQMGITLKRDEILALEFVDGGYGYRQQKHQSVTRRRLRQVFCHVRSGATDRVIVHSATANYERGWRAYAQELAVPFERHDLPRKAWPQMD